MARELLLALDLGTTHARALLVDAEGQVRGRALRRLAVHFPAPGRVDNADSSYTRFAYSYAPSAEAAFEKECRNYDDFGGNCELDNVGRPEQALGARESAWHSRPSVGLPGLSHAFNWSPEAGLLRIDSA